MSVILEIIRGVLGIITAPFKNKSVLWQIIPIILMWITLEIYFGKWDEELGWNSALANALTLFWITLSMMQIIFGNKKLFSWNVFVVLIIMLAYAIFLIIVVFKHSLRDSMAFLIAGPTIIHISCYLIVLWSNKLIVLSWTMLASAIIFLGLGFGITKIIKLLLKD